MDAEPDTNDQPKLVRRPCVILSYNGISLVESPPGNACPGYGTYGPYHTQNVLVKNNTITMSQGATGAFQDGDGPWIYTTRNNHFQNNIYHVSDPNPHPGDGYSWNWFAWTDTFRSWAEWQGYGNDTTGSFGT